MQIAKRQFKRIRKLAPQIKAWIESNEFKEKYANRPYPPLLNPQNIDYESIPADLAWELNLPLPPYYDLIYFNNGASASLHILEFFKHCKITLNPYWIGASELDYYQKYELDYNLLLKRKNAPFNVIALYLNKCEINKYIALLGKSTPLFYVARDPISRIKSACNHDAGVEIIPNMKHLSINDTDFTTLFPKTKYWSKDGEVSTPQVKTGLFYPLLYPKICFDSFLAQMPHLGKKYIFSFESFAPNCAFETFKQIAKIFNLNMPNDDRLFNTRAEKARFGLGVLPVIVEHSGAKIHISADLSVCSDSKNKILTESVIGGGQKHYFINDTEIIIYADKSSNLTAHKDFGVIKAYLQNYIKALENNVAMTLKSLVSEAQILKVLRDDTQNRKALKELFDRELGYLKANHSDIVASWKYYKEFEAMCAELDST